MQDRFPSYRFLANIATLAALAVFILLVHTYTYKEQLQAENEMLRNVQSELRTQAASASRVSIQNDTNDEPTGDAIAIRNKNPLNIKCFSKKDPWRGQIGTDKFGHAIFESWEYGLRAASLTLRSYAHKHKIDTIKGLVMRFAHGNQQEYIKYLCRKLHVEEDQEIDLIVYMPKLLRHMSRFESGQELPDRWFAPYDILAKL